MQGQLRFAVYCYVFVVNRKLLDAANRMLGLLAISLVVVAWVAAESHAASLQAGAAKIDITNEEAGPVHGRLFARALVISDDTTSIVLITIDAVALGEIGHISNDFLSKVRGWIQRELNIPPSHVLINASHCHGIVTTDIEAKTCDAVRKAWQSRVPVQIAAGTGNEDRIMENRRLRLKDGREVDVRHAYSLPPDDEVLGSGPIDPEIGFLRLDAEDGRTVAIVYNFACHPIQGVPGRQNTSDLSGFASQVLEQNLSPEAVALFVQGCAGDINPIDYKDVHHPRDAELLGERLGLSVMRASRQVASHDDGRLALIHESLKLPRADFGPRIRNMEAKRDDLVKSLQGTSLDLKSFVPLYVKYALSPDFPSYASHRYLHDQALGRDDLSQLDAENRANLERYIHNIETMERLTRVNTNLALLRKHQAEKETANSTTIDVEVAGLRVGEFVLLTFPGELSVQIGLNIKRASPHDLTFVAGYTNGYIYYAPTSEQLKNPGGAQEDCDCILAPEWQEIFETKAAAILGRL
jgi:hypothetical protein